jgi:outer membrane lipoprotein carrier protein
MAYRLGPLLCLLLLFAPSALAQSETLTLADVTAAYRSVDGLSASFEQVLSSDFARDSMRVNGSVVLSGNKYRVKTPDQTVVSDGSTTWIYTPADSQVVVNDADGENSRITPETFLTASTDRYEVNARTATTRLGTPHVRLDVGATDPAARFESVRLWVRRSDRLVTRMQATDRDGSTIDLRLRNLTVNPERLATDSPFRFSPPQHVEVIDLRSDP